MRAKTIGPGSLLTLHYRLTGPDGTEVLSTFAGTPATLAIGTGELSPPLEARLIGLAEGAHETFALPPGAAYGDHNPALLQRVPRRVLAQHGDPDETYAVGDAVAFDWPGAQGRSAAVVRACEDDALVFDFNHPLAGCAVHFEVQVIGVL